MIRSPDYMIATATRLLPPSCLLPNEVQHSHLTCILLTWLQKEENSKVIQASGSCSLRSALLYISQNEGHTHTAEFSVKVKKFSLKIDLIVFKLEMFCISLQNHI